MISAAEVWQIAMPAMEEKYQEAVKTVESTIKNAAREGKTNAYFNAAVNLMSPEQIGRLIEELKDAGYRAWQISGGILEIYWDKEEKK